MAANAPVDWRISDRRLYLAAAILFPLIILIGFGRTYYFKMFSGTPALPTLLVHLHAIVMTAWVVLFVSQVGLIRTKNAKVHMKLGMLGVALAVLIVIVGFFTAAAAAKYGSFATPPDIPSKVFLVVPLFDLIGFIGTFGAAFYYRKQFATHKRFMLLTVINFLPPALGRLPIQSLQSLGPLMFFGIPALLTIGVFVYDWRHNGKVNRPFLIGCILLIASFPLRFIIAGTDAWMTFATWVTSWAA
ncbi:MAG: hypothetical protein ABJA02_04055 [Acidobacteriota bacterium]